MLTIMAQLLAELQDSMKQICIEKKIVVFNLTTKTKLIIVKGISILLAIISLVYLIPISH